MAGLFSWEKIMRISYKQTFRNLSFMNSLSYGQNHLYNLNSISRIAPKFEKYVVLKQPTILYDWLCVFTSGAAIVTGIHESLTVGGFNCGSGETVAYMYH